MDDTFVIISNSGDTSSRASEVTSEINYLLYIAIYTGVCLRMQEAK